MEKELIDALTQWANRFLPDEVWTLEYLTGSPDRSFCDAPHPSILSLYANEGLAKIALAEDDEFDSAPQVPIKLTREELVITMAGAIMGRTKTLFAEGTFAAFETNGAPVQA